MGLRAPDRMETLPNNQPHLRVVIFYVVHPNKVVDHVVEHHIAAWLLHWRKTVEDWEAELLEVYPIIAAADQNPIEKRPWVYLDKNTGLCWDVEGTTHYENIEEAKAEYESLTILDPMVEALRTNRLPEDLTDAEEAYDDPDVHL